MDHRRRRHHFIPGGIQPMEARLVPSSIGLAHASPATAELGHPTASMIRDVVAPTVHRWSWFAGTYWYVPPQNLTATVFYSQSNTILPVSDQTVFQITGYRSGYFWGKSVTQIGTSSPSGTSMVGSVTPEGRVLLTFTTTSQGGSPTVTEGFGQMRRKFGQWTMENQMFTAPGSSVQLGHWAYMVTTRLGRQSWDSLPGVGVSVPTFLGEVSSSAPRPVPA